MIEFLAPWKAASDRSDGLHELRRELPSDHVLAGIPLSALGFRQDCDDMLFALQDGSARVAVVHLTFQKERDPRWPATELFNSIEDFASTRMQEDHDDFFM